MHLEKLKLSVIFLILLLTYSSTAQAPAPNADIVKMIQAGLPESTVVNKIHEGAGHWDTSVDALVALKQAGATESELAALTSAPPTAEPTLAATTSMSKVSPTVPFKGGQLSRTNNIVVLRFPASPNGHNQELDFYVVLASGQPALCLTTEGYLYKGIWRGEFGDLVITHDRLTFTPYAENMKKVFSSGSWAPGSTAVPLDLPLAEVTPSTEMNGKKLGNNMDRNGTTFSKKFKHWNLDLGDLFGKKVPPTPQGDFLLSAISNFDATMSELLSAAGITNPAKQLAGSEYHTPSPEFIAQVVQAHNVAHNQKNTSSSSGGASFLAFANTLQGFANMQAAVQQGNIAAANHDTAGQLQAALNAGTAEINTIQSVTNPTAPLQPVALNQPNIQTTTNQQLAKIQAAQARAQAAQAAKSSQVAKASPPPQLHPTTQLKQAPSSGEAEAPISTAAAPATPCPTANSGLLETQPCVPASCISMNHVVHLQSEIFAAAPKEEREVVGYFTNNSISDVTCTWAFHKDGQWAEIGTGYVKKGATHQGGQGGGVWTVGADSYDMKYSCFMGIDPVDAQGHYCTLGVVFSGQTSAGTDIR